MHYCCNSFCQSLKDIIEIYNILLLKIFIKIQSLYVEKIYFVYYTKYYF